VMALERIAQRVGGQHHGEHDRAESGRHD
jgi:hypothetical protein